MAKLICMRGLPASGKSTRAQQIVSQNNDWVRINRDLLRTMLHFDIWNRKKETITVDTAHMIAEDLLSEGLNVIIDDTNLNPKVLNGWKIFAETRHADFEIIDMNTPMEECLRRDYREKPVGRHVIVGMALQYGLYPKPKKGFVLCDIDGTLADVTHRLHFARQDPKDWDSFHGAMSKDTVREDVWGVVNEYRTDGYDVIFVSGRPDNYRKQTEYWLERKCSFMKPVVFMRRADDHRPDTIVKEQMLKTYFSDFSQIYKVVDDRPSVIREVWKKYGLPVWDVGKGEEF